VSSSTRVKTKLVERHAVLAALDAMGCDYEAGDLVVRGYEGKKTAAELHVRKKKQRLRHRPACSSGSRRLASL